MQLSFPCDAWALVALEDGALSWFPVFLCLNKAIKIIVYDRKITEWHKIKTTRLTSNLMAIFTVGRTLTKMKIAMGKAQLVVRRLFQR